MKCSPVGYHGAQECDERCPFYEGCKKQLKLPKEWKQKQWREVRITEEEALTRVHHRRLMWDSSLYRFIEVPLIWK